MELPTPREIEGMSHIELCELLEHMATIISQQERRIAELASILSDAEKSK